MTITTYIQKPDSVEGDWAYEEGEIPVKDAKGITIGKAKIDPIHFPKVTLELFHLSGLELFPFGKGEASSGKVKDFKIEGLTLAWKP